MLPPFKKEATTSKKSKEKKRNANDQVTEPSAPAATKKAKSKKSNQEKPVTEQPPSASERILDEPEAPEMTSIRLRTTPSPFNNAISLLTDDQKEAVKSFGFGSLLDFNIGTLPHMLCHFVVEKFDMSDMTIKLERGVIKVDSQAVHDVFGIPMGGTAISGASIPEDDVFVKGWLSQFPVQVKEEVEKPDTETAGKTIKNAGKKRGPKPSKKVVATVRPNAIATKISENMGQLNQYFKMNFVMLFITSLFYCDHNGAADLDTLNRVSNDADFRSLDWCSFVLEFLCKCNCWQPNKYNKHYHGPATLLTLLYLDRTDFNAMTVPRARPIFKNWSRFLVARETREIQLGSFGTMGVRPAYNAFGDIGYSLMEMSNIKKELFDAFDKEKQIDPENPTLKFYYSKFEEVCSMDTLFYNGQKPNDSVPSDSGVVGDFVEVEDPYSPIVYTGYFF